MARTSVFYTDPDRRAEHLRWPIPKGGPKAFFTTWNAAAAVLVTALCLLTIPWMRAFPSTQKVAAFTVIPLAIAIMASIVCTTIISQMMLAFNVKIDRDDKEPDDMKNCDLSLSVGFVQKMLCYNFLWHMGPLIFVVLLGLGITLMPGPSTLVGKGSVFLTTFLYFSLFVLAWLLTPTKTSQEGEEPVEMTGWEKIMHVYRSPPSYYFTCVFPIIAIIVMVVGVFALYGSLDAKGMKSF